MEYGLIGKKLGHSFSKTIHEKIGGYSYDLIELDEPAFSAFMKNPSFKAINVTIPYKEKVIPYLDEISPAAKRINAVNTVINVNGKLYGDNTDYIGFTETVKLYGIDVSGKNVLILGTGGTSKTTACALSDLNAKNILFVSRTKREGVITYEELPDYYDYANIIVNTTPCEMYPNNNCRVIDIKGFKNLEAVLDVVYNPLRTNLILSAKKAGIKCAGGLNMLVAQAFYATELFLDKKLDKSLISDTFNALVKEKENIVLIGMPSAGKSSIGRLLAQKLNKTFYDVDEEIVKVIGMDIPSYFEKYGEESFREVETRVVYELSVKNSCVIATGGGSVLKDENVNYLKQNGKLVFLDRPLEKLIATDSRPLSSSTDKLKKLYNVRYPRYLSVCDIRIDCNRSIEEILSEAGELLK